MVMKVLCLGMHTETTSCVSATWIMQNLQVLCGLMQVLLGRSTSSYCRPDFLHHKVGLIVDLESPLNFRLIVEANHKVGHELEEVLPQAQEEVQVEIADIYLAVYP